MPGLQQAVQRDALPFGERLPNPFAEGEMTQWFHPACAAYKRPEPFLQALGETSADVSDREELERAARGSLAHRRLSRIDGAERAPSGQAKCRGCGQPIVRGSWRIRLVFYDEGRFAPAGFISLDCRRTYFETDDILDQLLHFSADLNNSERGNCGGRTLRDEHPENFPGSLGWRSISTLRRL